MVSCSSGYSTLCATVPVAPVVCTVSLGPKWVVMASQCSGTAAAV